MIVKNILSILTRNKQCHQLSKLLNERFCSQASRNTQLSSGKC